MWWQPRKTAIIPFGIGVWLIEMFVGGTIERARLVGVSRRLMMKIRSRWSVASAGECDADGARLKLEPAGWLTD